MVWNILKTSTLGKPKIKILDHLVTSSDVKAWFHSVTNCNVISDRSFRERQNCPFCTEADCDFIHLLFQCSSSEIEDTQKSCFISCLQDKESDPSGRIFQTTFQLSKIQLSKLMKSFNKNRIPAQNRVRGPQRPFGHQNRACGQNWPFGQNRVRILFRNFKVCIFIH